MAGPFASQGFKYAYILKVGTRAPTREVRSHLMALQSTVGADADTLSKYTSLDPTHL